MFHLTTGYSIQISFLLPFQINIGHVSVPRGLITTPPPPPDDERVLLGPFNGHVHNVRGELYALDETTLLLTNFHYDGTAPGMLLLLPRKVKYLNYHISAFTLAAFRGVDQMVLDVLCMESELAYNIIILSFP